MAQAPQSDPVNLPGVMSPEYRAFSMLSPSEKWERGYSYAFEKALRGLGQRLGLISQEDVDKAARANAPLEADPTAQYGQQVGEFGLGTITGHTFGAAGSLIPKVGALPGWLRSVTSLSGQGALGGASVPTTTGQSPTTNVLMGAGLAPLVTLPFSMGRRAAGSLLPDIEKETADWASRGKELTGAYLPSYAYTDRPGTQFMAWAGKHLPFGKSAPDVAAQARDRYTRAVSNLFGEDTNDLRAAVANATERIGNDFQRLADTYGVTEPLRLTDARALTEKFRGSVLGQAEGADSVQRQLDTALDQITGLEKTGTFTGDDYRSLRGQLYTLATKAGQKGFGDAQQAAFAMRKAIDDAMRLTVAKTGSAEDVNLLEQANRQWTALRTVSPELGKPIYDKNTGLIQFNALHNAMVKTRPKAVLGNESAPTGDDLVDTANLGVTAPYQKMQADLATSEKSGGHGLLSSLTGGIPGGTAALATYELMPHEQPSDIPTAGMAAALALAGTVAGGASVGKYMTSPVSTMPSSYVRWMDPVIRELVERPLPSQIMPEIHRRAAAAGATRPTATPGQWEFVEPSTGQATVPPLPSGQSSSQIPAGGPAPAGSWEFVEPSAPPKE